MIHGDGGHAKVVKSLTTWRPYDGCIIAIGDNATRKREVLAHPEYIFTVATHETAWTPAGMSVGVGTVIMAGAIIQPGAVIGKHCIINTGATVDHDCVLEDYVHIAPGAHLCGNVHVGEGTLVGVGVGIAPGAKIPAWSLVKARRLEIVPQ